MVDDVNEPSKRTAVNRTAVNRIGVVGPAVLSSVILGAIFLLSDVYGLVNLFSSPWPVIAKVVGAGLVVAGVLLLIRLWHQIVDISIVGVVILMCTGVASLVFGVVGATLPADLPLSSSDPHIDLSPNSGAPGDIIVISGRGYEPNKALPIVFGSAAENKVIGNAIVDSRGELSQVKVQVPRDQWWADGAPLFILVKEDGCGHSCYQEFFLES